MGAGVRGDHGVRGNGHAMMLERNNERVLSVLTDRAARRCSSVSSDSRTGDTIEK